MKKYKMPIIIITAVIVIVVAFFIYRKVKVSKAMQGDFDNYNTPVKKNQILYLKENMSCMQMAVDDNKVLFATGELPLTRKDKLYFVRKYNDFFLVKRKGWFFDRYFIISPKYFR